MVLVMVLMVLVILRDEQPLYHLDGLHIGPIEQLKGRQKLRQVSDPALRNQLYTPVKLRDEPQHLVVQSAQIGHCLFALIQVLGEVGLLGGIQLID